MEKATLEKFKQLFIEVLTEEDVFQGKLFPQGSEGDEVDIVSLEKENQMDFRLRARNAIYLKKVKRSLQKIEEGTFGECEECGEEISFNRLLARPTADLCIKCKEEQEREENQLVHKNKSSLKGNKKILPIDKVEKGYNRDETNTMDFSVSHYDYQDIVV